jgi:hypothetical protein
MRLRFTAQQIENISKACCKKWREDPEALERRLEAIRKRARIKKLRKEKEKEKESVTPAPVMTQKDAGEYRKYLNEVDPDHRKVKKAKPQKMLRRKIKKKINTYSGILTEKQLESLQ